MGIKTPQFILKIRNFLDEIHIPVLGISLWKMFEIYGQGVFKMQIGRSAASISWSFFLSLFPFILFLLSVNKVKSITASITSNFLWFAIIFRQKLQLIPREAIENSSRAGAIEQIRIRIGLSKNAS